MRVRAIPAWTWGLVAAVALCGGMQHAGAQTATITEVRVTDNRNVTSDVILQAAGRVAREGQTVDDLGAALRAMRDAVLRLGYFDDAVVSSAPAPGGVVVTITVRERMRVAKVTFDGATAIPEDELLEIVRTRPGRFLDRRVMERDVQRITDAYEERGILGRAEGATSGDGGEVTFQVQEIRLAQVRFVGLHAVTVERAAERLDLKPGAVLSEQEVAEAMQRLQATGWFQDLGVRLARPAGMDPGRAALLITVTEVPGLLADHVGPPVADLDPAALRADVMTVQLDVEYQAGFQVDDVLVDLDRPVEEALQSLAEQAAAEDALPAVRLRYALLLRSAGDDQEMSRQAQLAADGFRAILDDQAQDVDALLGLGRSLGLLDDHQGARSVLRQALQHAPENVQVPVALARVTVDEVILAFGRDAAEMFREASTASPADLPVLQAIIELMPWERTRAAMLAAIVPPAEPHPLVAPAREARAHLAAALQASPDDTAVLRAAFHTMLPTAFTGLNALGENPDLWVTVTTEAHEVVQGLGDMARVDPGLALWAAFFESFHTVLMLVGQEGPDTSQEQATEEFRRLARHLTAVSERWPHVLRTSGSILGLLQLMAGENALARATFEEAISQNPYDRQNYNALLGLAFNEEDWDEMERVVRRRLEVNPAAEDHVLLGKLAERKGDTDAVLGHFRDAVNQSPEDPLGLAATAGWLLRTGADDDEALALANRAASLNPRLAYAHSVRAAILALRAEAEQATNALRTALQAEASEELANLLRERYFEIN